MHNVLTPIHTTLHSHGASNPVHPYTHPIPSIPMGHRPMAHPRSVYTGSPNIITPKTPGTPIRVFPPQRDSSSSFQTSTSNDWSVRTTLAPPQMRSEEAPKQAPVPPRRTQPHALLLRSRCKPLPSQSSGPIQLHPILRHTPNSTPDLDIDLSASPETIQTILETPNGNGVGRYLRDPATQPAIPSLTVMHPQLPWGIMVYCSVFPGCVTVADVLQAIWRELRRPLDEWEELEVIWQAGVGEQSRQHQHRRNVWDEMNKGKEGRPTRLDCLLGKHRFVGLDTAPCDGDTWNMAVL